MKKILFIDRDGTVIIEPPVTFQVDSLEKLEFYPKAIRNLYQISSQLHFELVMVTNQDGLGTTSFPEDDFWVVQNKMLKTLENEGVEFQNILIDKTFEYENAPTRKPRTGLMKEYIANPQYDLVNSFVIGDRMTDMQLAYNLGAKGILIGDPSQDLVFPDPAIEEVIVLITTDWDEIFQFLQLDEKANPPQERTATIHRKTLETDVFVRLKIEGEGKYQIKTGLGFFDHMLEQLAKHSKCDLEIEVKGDLHIDEHHTIEDTAIALGEAFSKAIGNKRGMERYGFCILPMDDSLAQVALDFSGRSWLVWQAEFKREKVGDMPVEMFSHFFRSFAEHSKCNLHIRSSGENDHHQIEAIFKAFARSIRMAIKRDLNSTDLPSTKGVL